MSAPKSSRSPQELEAALDGLVTKFQELQGNLSQEEKIVFAEIIESAALHTQFVEAADEMLNSPDTRVKSAYLGHAMKPKSVHSTTKMKQQYLKLPQLLGMKGEE